MTVEQAFQLLRALGASPRLVRHHELVVDTANELVAGVLERFPQVRVDVDLVLCGAALHDVGKVRVPDAPPRKTHEAAGEALLLTLDVPPTVASCCRARTDLSEATPLEVMMVALADALWNGQRDKLLEQAFADRLSGLTSDGPTEVWVAVDALLSRIAADGPRREAEAAAL